MSWTNLESKLHKINSRFLSLFQVDIEDILRNKFEWMDQKNISTEVIDSWYYWEYEQFIKLLNEKNKEEQEHKKKQEEEQGAKYGNFNPSKMMNNYNPSKMIKNYGNMGNNSAFPRF